MGLKPCPFCGEEAVDDLISRAALLNDLSYCAPELWRDEEYVKAKIMKQPAVDAAPVVRCRDCEHAHRGGCMLTLEGGWNGDYWFCAAGERRERE